MTILNQSERVIQSQGLAWYNARNIVTRMRIRAAIEYLKSIIGFGRADWALVVAFFAFLYASV
jgi:hypothetical protein